MIYCACFCLLTYLWFIFGKELCFVRGCYCTMYILTKRNLRYWGSGLHCWTESHALCWNTVTKHSMQLVSGARLCGGKVVFGSRSLMRIGSRSKNPTSKLVSLQFHFNKWCMYYTRYCIEILTYTSPYVQMQRGCLVCTSQPLYKNAVMSFSNWDLTENRR